VPSDHDESLQTVTTQFIGTSANARVLVDAFKEAGLDADYRSLASTRRDDDVVEVGIMTVTGAPDLDAPVRVVLNRVLQGEPVGEIGVSRITADAHGEARNHEADLHAFLRKSRFSARLTFAMADPEPERGRRCPECRGRKQLPGMIKTTGMGTGMGSAFGPCPTCDGLGYVTDEVDE
jgi:hypothetical protein